MARILCLVEGQTEETFVNELLAPHLLRHGQYIEARLLGNARQRSHRGGIKPWRSARNDIVRYLSQDKNLIVTTMVDYYGMPASGEAAWPGRSEAQALPVDRRSDLVAKAIRDDILGELGDRADPTRLIPFVTMHEFEALLFADGLKAATGFGVPQLGGQLVAICEQFETPEHIDDSPINAPSKRIERLFPGYQKPLHGNLAALDVGLNTIREHCPGFSRWVSSLERCP